MMLEKQYHDEMNMELQGITYSASLSNKNEQASNEKDEVMPDATTELEQVAEDARNLSMVTMSRKNRKLYEAMQVLVLFSAIPFINSWLSTCPTTNTPNF